MVDIVFDYEAPDSAAGQGCSAEMTNTRRNIWYLLAQAAYKGKNPFCHLIPGFDMTITGPRPEWTSIVHTWIYPIGSPDVFLIRLTPTWSGGEITFELIELDLGTGYEAIAGTSVSTAIARTFPPRWQPGVPSPLTSATTAPASGNVNVQEDMEDFRDNLLTLFVSAGFQSLNDGIDVATEARLDHFQTGIVSVSDITQRIELKDLNQSGDYPRMFHYHEKNLSANEPSTIQIEYQRAVAAPRYRMSKHRLSYSWIYDGQKIVSQLVLAEAPSEVYP